jgi:hypothetical protein
MSVGVGVADGSSVGVAVGVAVRVALGVAVRVAVRVALGVAVRVPVGVAVTVDAFTADDCRPSPVACNTAPLAPAPPIGRVVLTARL